MISKFVISTFEFTPHIGGITVLHKLCHLLNENGYDAYLSPSNGFGLGHGSMYEPFRISPRYNVKIVNDHILSNMDDVIVIYPESWFGNYLNGKNVVRWILGPPSNDRVSTWSDSDLWFWYSSLYNSTSINYGGYKKDTENYLCVLEFYEDIFKVKNTLDRDINSWTLRKSAGYIDESKYIHEQDSILISYDDAGRLDWLSEIFNRSNRFYSYDPYTFLSLQSVMCGADSIVVPIDNLSMEDFLKHSIFSKYISYGVDDLSRSRSHRNELKDHIQELEQNTIRDLHLFVEKCNNYFRKTL